MKCKGIKNFIVILLFIALITMPMFCWHILSFNQTFDFDIGEKRNKATMSEVFNINSFPHEFEGYFNDRIPFRSMLIFAKQEIDAFVEKPYKTLEKIFFETFGIRSKGKILATEVDGIVRLYMDDAVDIFRNHKLKKSDIDPFVTGIEYPIKKLGSQVIQGQSDWLYLNVHNVPYYIGSNTPSAFDLQSYKYMYNAMNELCKANNKQIIFLICPEKEEIYPEYMPTMEIKNQIERPIYIREFLATASDITYLYPKDILLKQKNNYRLYKKYDSHWNDTGAYLVANELKRTLGIKTINLRDLLISKIPESNKDLLYLAGISRSEYNDSFEYYISYKPQVKVDLLYTDSDVESHIYDVKSNADDKRHILILGDSYSISMISFLSKDFSRLTFCTFNYMNNSKVVNDAIKNADIIVVQAVTRNESESVSLICKKIVDVLLYEQE